MKRITILSSIICLLSLQSYAQHKFLQIGFGSAISSSQSDKMVGLHPSYPIGTRLLVKNKANGSSVVVKIIGSLPNTAENDKLIIKLSQAACKAIKASGKRFTVELYTAPPEGEENVVKDSTKQTPKPKEKIPEKKDDELTHKVAAGETLYSISKKYKVKVEEIMDWNKLEKTTLYKGQVLKILKKN